MWESEREMAPRWSEWEGAPYPVASARPRRLVSVCGAVEAVGRAAIGPVPRPVEADVVL